MVAGSRLPENAAFARLAAERSGPATASLLGHRLKGEPMLATLVNATAGVALEVDEGNRFGGGHPAIHSLPGALAVAEEMGATGRQLIESILVGYEVESRMGGATRVRPNVHSHGHWGAIGTAAAVARLRGFNPAQVRAVVNLAASMSPANTWTPAFKGATIRNLYPGRSGLQGIMAIHLYDCGYTGLDDGPADVFGTILGEVFDPHAAVEDLGGEYRIQQNYFKFHACCRINHPSLDAIFKAAHLQDIAPEHVESVDIATQSMLPGMLGPYPDNMLAAKFNVPYAVAAALVRGSADVADFQPEAIGDERIRELAAKVHIKVEPGLATGEGGPGLAAAEIRLNDGRALKGTATIVPGDYGNRLPRQELLDKFHSLNDSILGAETAHHLVKAVGRLERLTDVRELTALLSG